MLTELIYYLDTLLDQEGEGRYQAERVLNSEVPCVRYLIGRIVKTYGYINRVVLMLSLSVYEGTWTHSPLSLLCITMILRVRRKFLKLPRSPTVILTTIQLFGVALKT